MKVIWLLKACRPKQWVKNLLCFSAIVITPNTSNLIFNISLATLSFIFASSTIYLINDSVDIDYDKNHPKKRNRPIALGKVKIWEAIFLAILFTLLSIYIASLINFKFLSIIVLYLFAQLFYCFIGKNLVLVDIYLISLGFVLRALGGVFALNSMPSYWFLITSGTMALFLAIQKRKSELSRVALKNNQIRKVLKKYTINFLEKMELITLSTGFISYLLWASGPIFKGAESSLMLLTCPVLLMGIFRYEFISTIKKDGVLNGESPTQILFSDTPIQLILISLFIACWAITNYA